MGRSLLIGDRELVLWLKFGFGLFTVSLGGSEVERWWKLNGLLVRSLADVALWCSGRGVLSFRGVFLWGCVVTMDGWILFLQWSAS